MLLIGTRRKLTAAIALACEPRVCFLDEPTTGVDVGTRQFLWERIRAKGKRGCTLVLTTHYMEEAPPGPVYTLAPPSHTSRPVRSRPICTSPITPCLGSLATPLAVCAVGGRARVACRHHCQRQAAGGGLAAAPQVDAWRRLPR